MKNLVILVCLQNKILLYVCVTIYFRVILCSLWHEYYLNNMWLLFLFYRYKLQFVISYNFSSIIL